MQKNNKLLLMRLSALALLLSMLFSCTPGQPETAAGGQQGDTMSVERDTLTVALQAFEDFDTALVSFAAAEIRTFFGAQTKVLPACDLPEQAWYPPRSRYRADSLLIFLAARKPAGIDHVLGLTHRDISCTKEPYADWGIFGYGCMPGPSCVVSTFRLRKNGADEKLFRERFAKVLLHELGHNFGLDHCPTKGCMMSDANGTIVTVDNESKSLCPNCQSQISNVQP